MKQQVTKPLPGNPVTDRATLAGLKEKYGRIFGATDEVRAELVNDLLGAFGIKGVRDLRSGPPAIKLMLDVSERVIHIQENGLEPGMKVTRFGRPGTIGVISWDFQISVRYTDGQKPRGPTATEPWTVVSARD